MKENFENISFSKSELIDREFEICKFTNCTFEDLSLDPELNRAKGVISTKLSCWTFGKVHYYI